MKRFFNLSAVWAALLACGVLLAAGCTNPLSSAVQPGSGAHGSVTINVNSGAERTLFPTANFTKYELSFAPVDPTTGSHDPVTITTGSSTVITDLAAGTWTVTAKGFVTLPGSDTSVEAASGTAPVTVANNAAASVTIPISASQTGGTNGKFSYSITLPADKDLTSATLDLSSYTGYSSELSVDLLDDSAKLTDSKDLEPGYYLLTITLRNALNQTAGKTEIVHIYSNLETKAEYAFAAENFTDVITLSGTLAVKDNDDTTAITDWSYASISAYAGNQQIGYQYLSSGASTWEFSFPEFATATKITFRVTVQGSSDTIVQNVEVAPADTNAVLASDIQDIVLEVTKPMLIKLSGTLAVKDSDGAAAIDDWQQAYIYAYAGNQYLGGQYLYSSTDTWEFSIPQFATATKVTFRVTVYSSSDYIVQNVEVAPPATNAVLASDISNIVLTVTKPTLIKLGGTLAVKDSSGEANEDCSNQAISERSGIQEFV
jgi:hypothetical protein